MRRLSLILFALLIVGNSPVLAADPNQIFDTILGEISRQIERKQQKKQLERLRPLWTACSKGDVAACDRAARFSKPNRSGSRRHRAHARGSRAASRIRAQLLRLPKDEPGRL